MQPPQSPSLVDMWHSDPIERRALEEEVINFALAIVHDRLPKGDVFEDPVTLKRFLALNLAPLQHEVFACLFLTAKNCLIEHEVMFRGSICATTIYPREVVKRALELNASTVVFAHNHPSGDSEPSAADRAMTKELIQALQLVDVTVLDHILVAAGGAMTSFAERGML